VDQHPLIQCDDGLRSHPAMARIAAAIAGNEPFVFADHLPLFEAILRSDLALQAVKLALHGVANDPDYQLSRFVMEGLIRGWTIVATEHFRISIGYRSSIWRGAEIGRKIEAGAGRAPGGLKMEPQACDLFLGVLNVGELMIEKYVAVPPASENDDYRLEYQSTLRLHPGDSMFLAAGRDLTWSKLQGNLIYLEITGNPQINLLPRFDSVDKRFCGWISGDPVSSRLEMLTRVLADLNYPAGVGVIEKLTHHRDHHVRWNSMRHLLRMDSALGISRVKSAAHSDPHRDVREVANEVLSQLTAWS